MYVYWSRSTFIVSFLCVVSSSTNSMKLYYPDSRVTVRLIVFPVRVVQLWNKLPEEVVSASSVSKGKR